MAEPRSCPACGQALIPGSRFCGKCGAKVAAARSGGGRGWMIAFLVAAVVAAGALVWIFVLRKDGVPGVKCPKGVCPKVGSAGGQLQVQGTGSVLDKVILLLEQGSVDHPVEVQVTEAPPDTKPPRFADPWTEIEPTLAGPIVRLEPDGQRFLKAISLTLPFDPAKIPDGRVPAVITWGGGHAELHAAVEIDTKLGTVQVVTTHFSDAVVIIDPGPSAIIVGMAPIDAPPMLGPTTNPPDYIACDETLRDVKLSLADGKYKLYNDLDEAWARFGVHPDNRTMLWYLYAEDGGAMSSIVTGKDQPIKPIRSGSEVALYKLIKAQIAAGVKPTAAMMIDLALQAVTRNGAANYAEAVLTGLNVVRAMARADKWIGDLVDPKGQPCPAATPDCGYNPKIHTHYGHPPTDPMMPIFRDLMGAESVDGGPTFMEMIGGKKGAPPSGDFLMRAFDPKTGKFAVEGGARSYIHNGGAHYYHWTGAVAQVFHSEAAATAGAAVEFLVTKLPSDPEAGLVQNTELLRGVDLARCIESRPPEPPPCPPQTRSAVKCPWTPDGYTVGECTPGFCWDGGPQGSLACKQIETPPGAGRNDLNNVVCNGTVPLGHDRCTGVHLGCTTPQ